MDANVWKQIVDKAIRNTKSRHLMWVESSSGPEKTLSFEAMIDASTTLSIWGYQKNYSYELSLTKQTAGEPFRESIRVTSKNQATDIDFSGLFKAAQAQREAIIRERAYNAVLDYLNNPTRIDPATNHVVFPENEDERLDDLQTMGYSRLFSYSQDEGILTLVRDLTAAGSIPWSLDNSSDVEGQLFSATVGDSDENDYHNLYLSLEVAGTAPRVSTRAIYIFEIHNGPNFLVRNELGPSEKASRRSWQLANELHSILSERMQNDEDAFKKIISDDIVHDILAALDEPHK